MPQLNPEFFVSQLFWLIITFSFLLLFLWRISLPRIGLVLEKRESKINDDIETAKKLQAEAEKIQNQIEEQLRETQNQTASLIKDSTYKLQNNANEELSKINIELNKKIDESAIIIANKKKESLQQIHEQIEKVIKLTLLKISSLKVSDREIKESISSSQSKSIF